MHMNSFFFGMTGPMVDQVVGAIALYAYLGYTCMVLARRVGQQELSWLAWVPVANLYLMVKMAGQEWWWVFGFFIPWVQLFVAGFIWSEIGKRLGKEWWLGLIAVIPLVGLLLPGYFVITTSDKPKHHPHHQTN